MNAPRGTYSIVAADPGKGEVGCAVQSKYFAVGWVVPWVRAGVGAVATQAAGVAAYGPRVLDLLAAGAEPRAALAEALGGDERRETRQLGVVDTTGRSASFTGAECNPWAGHVEGAGYAAQGNILVGEDVVHEMARAFEASAGERLEERLMRALEAAQAAGGDRRGQQSAALVVERAGAATEQPEGIDRVCDLRVDDHEEAVAELRRLLGIKRRWDLLIETSKHYERGEYEAAFEISTRALELGPDDPLLLYNHACYASLTGRRDEALANLERAVAGDASYLELARGDADFAPLVDDPEFRRIVAPP